MGWLEPTRGCVVPVEMGENHKCNGENRWRRSYQVLSRKLGRNGGCSLNKAKGVFWHPFSNSHKTECNILLPNIEPQTPQEWAKAKRLWKAYRWTWAMYQALGAKQGWKCAICGRRADGGVSGGLDRLNLDHRHFTVRVYRNSPEQIADGIPKWVALVEDFDPVISACRGTKQAAIAAVKELALPCSVRGLLCPGRHGKAGHGCCNRLLGRVDNPDWLEKARNYLLNPPAKDLQL